MERGKSKQGKRELVMPMGLEGREPAEIAIIVFKIILLFSEQERK
jgi:hypothetical protein